MKRFIYLMLFFGIACTMGAQTEENLFELQNNNIVAKDKYLGLLKAVYTNEPTNVYKEYDVYANEEDTYTLKIIGFESGMSELGTFDGFEIYHRGNRILRHLSDDQLYDVRYITEKKSHDYFIKVPLSDDSFALFFGGWLFGSGDETTEMVVVVVSGDKAKVVFEDYAYAYKYIPGDNFSIEFIDDINGLYDKTPIVFPESYMKVRMKYKIWKEGNMLKYKSWK